MNVEKLMILRPRFVPPGLLNSPIVGTGLPAGVVGRTLPETGMQFQSPSDRASSAGNVGITDELPYSIPVPSGLPYYRPVQTATVITPVGLVPVSRSPQASAPRFFEPISFEPPAAPCGKKVSLHSYEGSPLESADRRDALKKLTDSIARTFALHGIEVEFSDVLADLPSFAATLLARGDDENRPVSDAAPNLFDYIGDPGFADAQRPAILLVQGLEAWNDSAQEYQSKLGVTPFTGANVAAVRFTGTEADEEHIRNELYHIFGLSDSELGATGPDSKHAVTEDMWEFMRRVCVDSTSDNSKQRIVGRKERKRTSMNRADHVTMYET